MKKIKSLIFIFLVLISFNVKAANDECDKDEYARLKELAQKVEFDYEYKLVDNIAKFNIKALNLNSDLKVLILEDFFLDKYQEFKDNSTHTATIDGFGSGEKVVITIKGYVPNKCSGKTVLTKTVKLPYYNYNYSEEKCRGNEDFKYCKQLVNNDINETTFNREFDAYLKAKETTKEEIVPATNSWRLIIIIGSILLALAVLVIMAMLIVKRRKKNSL